jgi:NAD(P)-dependent dehydrogenase (short-subunit alcohol dehydrogenase family)
MMTLGGLLDLTSKVAVITGSGAGMGRATAELLAAAGAHVVVADVDSGRIDATVAAIGAAGGTATGITLDVSDVDALTATARAVAADHGRLDIWVNNAGIYPPAPLFASTVKDWDRMQDINSRAVYFGTREAARWMIRGGGGVVVNIASIAAYRAGSPNLAHYAASKAAVVVLTKTMANALGRHGIRVVGVSPGVIVTDGLKAGMATMDSVGVNLGNRGDTIPIGRAGVPEDIANAVLFLVSDMASFITGTTLDVDGGDLIKGAADVPDLASMGYDED